MYFLGMYEAMPGTPLAGSDGVIDWLLKCRGSELLILHQGKVKSVARLVVGPEGQPDIEGVAPNMPASVAVCAHMFFLGVGAGHRESLQQLADEMAAATIVGNGPAS
jgi:hypothetical protein